MNFQIFMTGVFKTNPRLSCTKCIHLNNNLWEWHLAKVLNQVDLFETLRWRYLIE